jgi:hypothetical protein
MALATFRTTTLPTSLTSQVPIGCDGLNVGTWVEVILL